MVWENNNRKLISVRATQIVGIEWLGWDQDPEILWEFIQRRRWLSIHIPAFIERVDILNLIFELSYAKTERRTKKLIENMPHRSLSFGTKGICSINHHARENLKYGSSITYGKIVQYLYIYGHMWRTSVRNSNSTKFQAAKSAESRNKTGVFAFSGKKFRNSRGWWSMYENESFAIMSVLKKLGCILFSSKMLMYLQATKIFYFPLPSSDWKQ